MMKIAARLLLIILCAGLGFLIRGCLPAGGPPAGMMGMGAMPPPAVKVVELKEMPLDVLDEYIASFQACVAKMFLWTFRSRPTFFWRHKAASL